MFFHKVDLISPPITLFFRGKGSHTSIFSGILTILSYIIIIYFSTRYTLDYLKKKKPTAYYVHRYIDDAGIYDFNSTSLFHYIYLTSKRNKEIIDFDFDALNIVGLDTKLFENLILGNDYNLSHFNHWVYGKCELSDVKDVKDLLKIDDYTKAACLKKYYSYSTGQYYDKNDPNFIPPSLKHGMSNDNYSFYTIGIERCRDDKLRRMRGLGSCKENDAINKIIDLSILNLDFLDHYPDVLDYHEPFKDYFFTMNHLVYTDSYVTNNLNLNPTLLKTNYGIVFDSSRREYSYVFDESLRTINDQTFEINDENGNVIKKSFGFIGIFNFYMQNNLQHYERTYQKFQDLLSKIGGFGKSIFLVMSTLNLLVAKFIVVLDIQDFLLSIDKSKYNGTNIHNSAIDINQTYENKKIFYDMKYKNKYLSPQVQNNEVSQINQKINNNIINETSIGNNNLYNFNKDINPSEQKKEEILAKPDKKVNFCWCQYIWDMICCGTSNKNIAYYEDFRKRILSEENLIISHSNLYKIINFSGLDNHEDFIFDKKYTTIIY